MLNSGTYEAIIWRYVPRWEQTDPDDDTEPYIRIEKGRVLQCEYDKADDDQASTAFEITLEGAVSSLVAGLAIASSVVLLSF